MNIKEEIQNLVTERISSSGNFLVEVVVGPGKITVTIDHPKGVKIDDCVEINRFLHERLDESGTFDRYELEVGSPGMEEPLKVLPQYEKRIGSRVSVLTYDGLKRMGTLLGVDSRGLDLDEEQTIRDGKKKEILKKKNHILFTDIKETRAIFSFDKII